MRCRVDKAIIPAAGLGKRLYPFTCKIPKEMFPIGNVPAIDRVAKEILETGIEKVGIIINSRKGIIREYFEDCTDCKIHWIYQEVARGLGDAILCAKAFIGDSPFLMALADEVFSGNPSQQLLDHFNGTSLVGLWKVEDRDRGHYGDIEIEKISEDLFRISKFFLGTKNKSKIKVIGRYVLSPELLQLEPDDRKGDELREGMLFDMAREVFGCEYYGLLLDSNKVRRLDLNTSLL